MINVIRLYGHEAVEFIRPIANGCWKTNDIVVIALLRNDDWVGAVVADKFDEFCCELTFHWRNRPIMVDKFVVEVCRELFVRQRRKVALMATSTANEPMLKLHERLGHNYVGLLPNRFGEHDGKLYSITDTEAVSKWLKRFVRRK